MALTESFNEFAGKVVSRKELTDLLKKDGFSDSALFDVNSLSPEEQMKIARKAQAAVDAGHGDELAALLSPSMYITSQALTDIEEACLKEETEDLAVMALKPNIVAHANDLYIDVQDVVKLVSWGFGDEKLANAFIKAATDCADHRGAVGKDLQEVNEAFQGIAIKIADKFGL